ncbi:ABC-2 type transport system ATP-binding protein [Kineothrix alysoides]|uniref:ABC-2 type transport system ATP-binding protein n=1 Tax=Kineothrix alysoides TaxID=1469948 RepID=A0A4R1R340_9FIRM|nr:ABC transporter ATP-binding protein [Kineothrix alysoides]TCL59821.1 ABC-2 type transport system ATP-binding protein [Kineothrix alysoides]
MNGAGKSTTIHMMLSLLKPASGSVYMLGSKVDFGSYELWGKVGFMEEASYYPELTVEENLDIARRMQMLPDRQCIPRIIKKLGLEAHKNKKAKNLSLGNRQRLGLSKAMIHNPEILILDEPINGLDPAGVVEIRETLLDLSKNHGVTVFLSSHLLEELAKLADRIGIIHEGKLVQEIEMTHLEQSLRKHLVLCGRDKTTMRRILAENGYRFEENADGHFILSEGRATEKPEKLSELLVRSGQPPTQLNIVSEDLEGYFFRTIQDRGGVR